MVAYANEMQMDTRSSELPEQSSREGEEDMAQGILTSFEYDPGGRVFQAMQDGVRSARRQLSTLGVERVLL